MPAISLLSPSAWIEVRKAFEHGVPLSTLAEKFNVPLETVRKRKQRENWTSLQDIQDKVVAMQKVKDESLGLSRDVPNGLSVAADTLQSNGERGSLILSQIGLKLLENALAKDGTTKISPLQTIQDVMVAGKAVRLPAGMDKDHASSVTVNVGGWAASVAAQAATGWSDGAIEGTNLNKDESEALEPE